jgi:hypothetical protein
LNASRNCDWFERSIRIECAWFDAHQFRINFKRNWWERFAILKTWRTNVWTRRGIVIDWSKQSANAFDSMRVNSESGSNETSESDAQ